MTVVRVRDIAEQIRGVTFSKGEASAVREAGYIPVLTASNITDDGLQLKSLLYVPESKVAIRQRLRQGDLVVTASSGSLSVVGRAALVTAPLDAAFGAFCKVLRPNQRVEPRFLAHFFRTPSYRARVSRLAAGANINNLRNEDLDDLVIPLPPLPEQRRIADILDRADDLRAKRRSAVALIEQAIDSLFLETFGDVVTNNRNWRRGTVSDLVARFTSGRSVVGDGDGEPDARPRVLKISAITSGRFISSESKPLPTDYTPPESHFVAEGDLLISRANTAELVGATARVRNLETPSVLPDKIWKFVWPQVPTATPTFVWKMFGRPEFRRAISEIATGSSGSMKNISQSAVLDLQVICPPLDLQRRFSEQVALMVGISDRTRFHLAKLDELFPSLQHRAFSGQL